MTTKAIRIPKATLAKLNHAHPITKLVLGIDRRLIDIDRAVAAYAATEIRAGRPAMSLAKAASALKRSQTSVRFALRRLQWAGYLRTSDRVSGPNATVFALDMPHAARFDLDIPRAPLAAEVALPAQPEAFDADAHREAGARMGFAPELTDELARVLDNLRLPAKRSRR